MTSPRYSSSERDRDVLEAFEAKLSARTIVVETYTAQGTTSGKITISCRQRPQGVLLIDARLYFDKDAPLTLAPNHSFSWDAGSNAAQVYEPSGLAPNTAYRLTYLVIGG